MVAVPPAVQPIVQTLVNLVGPDVLHITDGSSRWPALATVDVEGAAVPVAIFVSQVGLSSRNRDDVERRFQNPGGGHPIVAVEGRTSLLLGIWDQDPALEVANPVLVSADPALREGRETRFSVFARVEELLVAAEKGWAEKLSDSNELIRYLHPALLPLVLDLFESGVELAQQVVQVALEASGLPGAPIGELPHAAERARRAGTTLVRDARFSRQVVAAYEGRCAMCGLGLGLVQGAHILPAAAPGSYDEPWNGLALCANHHLAFDRHLVAVDPESRQIALHPMVHEQANQSPAVAAFIQGTHHVLATSAEPTSQPLAAMFEQRYVYFAGLYAWMPQAADG